MKDILIGVDIGTSACKVVAFLRDGTVVAKKNRDYPVYYPKPGWAEQNPEQWWEAVCELLKELVRDGISADRIAGIGVDGQGWSAVAVSKNGSVKCRTPIWLDTRAEKICDEMKDSVGERRMFEACGNPLQPTYTMPKVLWYKKNFPDIYRDTFKILQSNGYIVYKLTGVFSQDPSQGYGWNCYNIENGTWDFELCRELGVDPELLPEIFPCHAVVGSLTKDAALQTGLCPDIPVVAGGLDAACGALGVGVIRPGQTQEQGGQAGGMSICMERPLADKRLILGAHVVPGCWLLQGGTVGGSGALRWFEKEFGEEEREQAQQNGTNSYFEIDKGAAKIEPGCEGLVFLPYLSGERSPIWNPKAKGIFFGVDYRKTRVHFSRAVMEGVAFSLRHNLETAKEAGASAGTLFAMGGAANSPLWMQMKSDITGCELLVPASDTATALGAAILAGIGTGVYADFEDAVRATIHVKSRYLPNDELREKYDRAYNVYRKLYLCTESLMNER